MTKKRKSLHLGRWLVGLGCLIVVGFLMLKPATEQIYHKLYPRGYQEYIEKYSEMYEVDKNLVYAVTKVESNFDPQAHSSADARGLMQITKDAFEWVQYRMGDKSDVTYENIFEPEVSIKYGVYMLSLLKEHMGTEYLAVCAYHAGMSNVRAWLEQPEYSSDGETIDKIPYSDTEWYVNQVFEAKKMYEELYT